MKIPITINIIMVFAAVLLIANSVRAEERLRVFEMGESGAFIAFPMTTDEIASEDAAYGQLIAASEKSAVAAKSNSIVFEMGESGHTVAFPMTAAEITAANAENARLAALESANAVVPPKPGVRFELSESGQIIEFPAPDSEIGRLAAAQKAWTLRPD